MGSEKGWSLQEILGRIAAQGQFREDNQIAISLFRLPDSLCNPISVIGKIPDNRLICASAIFMIFC